MARRSTVVKGRFQPVRMGLGEAVRRLIHVEWMFRSGAGTLPEQLLSEREMILEALNVIPVEVGFDCNADGIPDTIDIFARSAATSCCRLMPPTAAKKATKKKTAKKKATKKKAAKKKATTPKKAGAKKKAAPRGRSRLFARKKEG